MNEAALTILKLILAEQYGELEYFKVKTRRKCKWVKFRPVLGFSHSFRWKDRCTVLGYDFTPVKSRLLIDWASGVDSSEFITVSRRNDKTFQMMYQGTWDYQDDTLTPRNIAEITP